MDGDWGPGPYGLTAGLRSTFPIERVVLFVAHHATAVTRLLDIAPIFEEDPRLQTVWTVPDTSAAVAPTLDFLRRIDARTVPWTLAKATRFDVAVSAALGALEQVNGPVAALDHGHGPAKRVRRAAATACGPDAPRELYGATISSLTDAGRVVPAVIGVAHERTRDLITRLVPEAGPVTEIMGDPTVDRLHASAHLRAEYRRALGVRGDQRLVVVSSTWGRSGLLGSDPDLPRRLAAELPAERYRVVAVQYPAISAWHGRRATAAWFASAQRAGLGVLPPEEGWRAALISADLIVADHSSVTVYGAAIDRPVLLAAFPDDEIAAGSLPARIAENAPRLLPGPPAPQVEAAIATHDHALAAVYAAALTSAPGAAARLIRDTVYRLMALAPPPGAPLVPPVPLPVLTAGPESAA